MMLKNGLFAAITGGFLLACNAPLKPEIAADTVLFNGLFYTLDEKQTWAQAIAIRDGRIVKVGSRNDVMATVGITTNKIDLQGRTVIPGINDAHVHPLPGGLKLEYECSFEFSATPDEIAQTISQCAKAQPDAQWIIGGQWDSDLFKRFTVDSPRALLDKAAPGKAVYLESDSGHDAWVSSTTLTLAGVNADSQVPAGGHAPRDDRGEFNGLLLEKARELVLPVVPDWSDAQYYQGLQRAMQLANRYGVTAMKSAAAGEKMLRAMADAANDARITTHLAGSIDMRELLDGGFDMARVNAQRDAYHSDQVDARYIKIFLDGVPTSSRTAAMLHDYQAESAGSKRHKGSLHFDAQQLKRMLLAMDSAGFTVKIHTAGDRSVRMALDVLAEVRRINGRSGLRHELAHAGFIAPVDLDRFKALNVVADLSPYLWHPSPIIDSVIGAVGPRGEEYWPVRSLIDKGAPILVGSDWPAAVPSINPWPGIEAMVNRRNPYTDDETQLWAEQAVSLPEALRLFIAESARALRKSDIGCLCEGNWADLAVLNQAIFEVPVSKLGDTEAVMTFYKGLLVYEAN